MKQLLFPLFKNYNVKAYICGHEHLSEHRTIYDGNYKLEHFIAGGIDPRPYARPCGKTKFCSIKSSYLDCTIKNKKLHFRYFTPTRRELYSVSV